MKFAHLGDCHLGGWRQPELRALNFQCFHEAIAQCIKEKVDFIVITGDLFDSAYPSIDTLSDAFHEFRILKESGIQVFLIAGSHDYASSGRSFLEVIERAGLCINVARYEERKDSIMLLPTIYKNVALYGYPGKKSGLEVNELEGVKLQDSPGMFKILMLHTAIRDALGSLPIPAVDEKKLPKVDYLALSHLHINYSREGRVYSGPIFPNNLSELEELQAGSFYFFDNGKIKQQKLKLKEVLRLELEITNSLQATSHLQSFLEQQNLKDKIVILNLKGVLEQGRPGDIDFARLEQTARKKGAYTFLKNISKLRQIDSGPEIETSDPASLEGEIIRRFAEKHPSSFSPLIQPLLSTLHLEPADEEKSAQFEERLFTETQRILSL